jgi:hypothetical protein
MNWPAVLLVLLVSHAVGDVLLQTNQQAGRKEGGIADARWPSTATFSRSSASAYAELTGATLSSSHVALVSSKARRWLA